LEPLQASGSVRVPITVAANSKRLGAWIWDQFGELVRTLVDETNPAAGARVLEWDRTDAAGRLLAPGYFIWRVTVDGTSESRLVRAT
jgi:flagellar hook assembly protein FlgD